MPYLLNLLNPIPATNEFLNAIPAANAFERVGYLIAAGIIGLLIQPEFLQNDHFKALGLQIHYEQRELLKPLVYKREACNRSLAEQYSMFNDAVSKDQQLLEIKAIRVAYYKWCVRGIFSLGWLAFVFGAFVRTFGLVSPAALAVLNFLALGTASYAPYYAVRLLVMHTFGVLMAFNVLYYLVPELVDCAYPEGDFSRRELVLIRDKIVIIEQELLARWCKQEFASDEKVLFYLLVSVGSVIVWFTLAWLSS